MFKQGVLRRWFTEGGVKYFKSGALRTITNITRNITEKKKRIPSFLQVYFKDFVRGCRAVFWSANFFTGFLKGFI